MTVRPIFAAQWKGSFPIDGYYGKFEYLNWAAKNAASTATEPNWLSNNKTAIKSRHKRIAETVPRPRKDPTSLSRPSRCPRRNIRNQRTRCPRTCGGQKETHGRSLAGLAVEPTEPSCVLYEPGDLRQTEAGPLPGLLCREKGLKGPFMDLGRHPETAVADLDSDSGAVRSRPSSVPSLPREIALEVRSSECRPPVSHRAHSGRG